MRHVSPLHRYGVLHGLLESKLHVQAFKDRVVLTPFLSFSVQTSAIVAAVEGLLYAVAEEEGRLMADGGW